MEEKQSKSTSKKRVSASRYLHLIREFQLVSQRTNGTSNSISTSWITLRQKPAQHKDATCHNVTILFLAAVNTLERTARFLPSPQFTTQIMAKQWARQYFICLCKRNIMIKLLNEQKTIQLRTLITKVAFLSVHDCGKSRSQGANKYLFPHSLTLSYPSC